MFATDAAASVYTQAEYLANAQRSIGHQIGIADELLMNTPLRQTTIMSAVLAQYIVDKTGNDAIDDGTTTTLLADLKTATDVATNIHAATAKTTPADADEIGIADSAASFALKKLTWANIKTALTGLFAPIASPAFTGTPTAPTASTGTDTTQIATVAYANAIAGGTTVPSGSLTTNGYARFANGLIIQWGMVTMNADSFSVTFPIAFPTACSFGVAGLAITDGGTTSPATKTKVGMSGNLNGSGTQPINWLAIGY